ncbi:MAG: hypothetical protein KTR28_03565 [Micavibrio sp.]|nr:hypothetical protein [Micavibrio sp.]
MSQLILNFLSKSLFDRIVIYSFLSIFLVKLIFEVGMGGHWFHQSQNKQWIFFGLLALDYLIFFPTIIKTRVTLNICSAFAFFLFIIIAQGIATGIFYNNAPFVIFNDTVPLLIMALNILRMQSLSEREIKPDFMYIAKICMALALATTIIGFAGQQIGRPTVPVPGNLTLFLPLCAALLFSKNRKPYWMIGAIAFMFAIYFTEFNRTSLAFILLAIGGFTAVQCLKSPIKGVYVGAAVIATIAILAVTLPTDSKIYQRIDGLINIDLSKRTGSVGERQAENDAVKYKLEKMGSTAQWFGSGFGGLYRVKFTHQWMESYGHAHYAWTWFNLRYGKLGMLYLLIMIGVLAYNGFRSFLFRDANGYLIGFLCLECLIYVFTYVNSIFLLSGLPFLHLYLSKERNN